MIQRLCLIGVGLIGGSVALALRSQGLVAEIIGFDTDPENLEAAHRLGIIDVMAPDVASAASRADWVILAAPVGAMPHIFSKLRSGWCEQTIYTDTGSTKSDVIAALQDAFGGIPGNFIPGHPIAGAERSGATAANPALFENRRVILTPVAETDAVLMGRVDEMWTRMGARVSRMSPEQHDRVLAATSHLPHVLAFVLTEMLGRKDDQEAIFQYAAGGFRDFTRIASSEPGMWLDICLANRAEIVPLIHEFRDALGRAAGQIENGDHDELLALFSDARTARQRFLEQLER